MCLFVEVLRVLGSLYGVCEDFVVKEFCLLNVLLFFPFIVVVAVCFVVNVGTITMQSVKLAFSYKYFLTIIYFIYDFYIYI